MSSRAGGSVLAAPIFLKWLGCLLVIIAIAVLLALTTVSELYPARPASARGLFASPVVARFFLFSYYIIAVGAALFVLNKWLEWRFRRQVANQKVICLKCGWRGSGE